MIETISRVIDFFRAGMPCLFRQITGLYCPGCGGTRASMHLLRGDVLKSIHYHPLLFYAVFVVLLELMSYAASKIFRKPGLHVKRYLLFIYIAVGIVIINWIWKNYFLVVRGIDLLP